MGVSIHAPVRERLCACREDRLFDVVSIHAPVRERPWNQVTGECWLAVSIHAPVRERRAEAEALRRMNIVSIHAPVRERRKSKSDCGSSSGFNSRSREGATYVGRMQNCVEMWFQFTLP